MIEVNEKYLETLKRKAAYFDEISIGIEGFYLEDREEDSDLCDIGEWIASYFNWI